MSRKLWIQRHVLGECAGRRVIEVGDRGELVKVLKVDHELPPDRTLGQVRDWFAELLGIPAVRP